MKFLLTFPESPKPLGLVCGVCRLGQSPLSVFESPTNKLVDMIQIKMQDDDKTRQSKECKTLRGPLSTLCYPHCILILGVS